MNRGWIDDASTERHRRQLERLFDEIEDLRIAMSEAMSIMYPDDEAVPVTSENIARLLIQRTRGLPEVEDCEHEGEGWRVEVIDVSPLPWDHPDLMAFRLELVRATVVEGWFIQGRGGTRWWNRAVALWMDREALRMHPKEFAFEDAEEAAGHALALIDRMMVNGTYWSDLEPAESQLQEFADRLSALIGRRSQR